MNFRNFILFSFLWVTPLSISAPSIAKPENIVRIPPEDFQTIERETGIAATALKTAQSTPPNSEAQKQALAKAEESKSAIVEIADKYPKSPVAAQTAGEALNGLKDYVRAAPLAERAVGLARDAGDTKALDKALLLRGDVHYGKKEYAAALADAEAVLMRDPRNAAALELKFASSGRADGGAEAAAGTTRSGYSSPARAPRQSASPTATASDPASAATTLDRQRSAALAREGEAKMILDPAAARELFDKAVRADPTNPRAYLSRAAARRAAGDLNDASGDLDRALALDPRLAEAHLAKASLLIALRRSIEEVKREFLSSGKAESDFSAYYDDQVARLAADKSKDARHDDSRAAMTPGARWVENLRSLLSGSPIARTASALGLALIAAILVYRMRRVF